MVNRNLEISERSHCSECESDDEHLIIFKSRYDSFYDLDICKSCLKKALKIIESEET